MAPVGRDRRVELEHARRDRPDQPGARHRLSRGRATSAATAGSTVHADQRLQRQQRPRGDPERQPANVIYTAGNAGNGGNPQPDGVILGAGAQIITRSFAPEAPRRPGSPTPVGSFNITQLGDKADKVGKDTNFRGLTIFDNVVYYTKGSGGNGVNTVYFVDTTGKACPNGVGPARSRARSCPTSPIAYDPTLLQTKGVRRTTCASCKGFPTDAGQERHRRAFPFGIWFANPTHAVCRGRGRRRQHVLDHDRHVHRRGRVRPPPACRSGCSTDRGSWNLAYTLQTGLNLGSRTPCPATRPGTTPVDRAAVGAGHRRAAQHHRPRQPRRHRRRSGRSPRPSAAAATRAPTRTSWSPSPIG